MKSDFKEIGVNLAGLSLFFQFSTVSIDFHYSLCKGLFWDNYNYNGSRLSIKTLISPQTTYIH